MDSRSSLGRALCSKEVSRYNLLTKGEIPLGDVSFSEQGLIDSLGKEGMKIIVTAFLLVAFNIHSYAF